MRSEKTECHISTLTKLDLTQMTLQLILVIMRRKSVIDNCALTMLNDNKVFHS